MAYPVFAVTVFCLVLWPAVSAMWRAVGLADDWPAALRGGAGAVAVMWLVAVLDLVGRWMRGDKLEPTADDGE